ncbi:MAG TPA: fumarylacetoacetate hydrolase family protein [Alphaproteobacteria bacterium]|nr:fumarylacetoacetate hydrolase family protein [Alphaproteobacteria bacterium]
MEKSRRDFVKLGAGIAVASTLLPLARAEAIAATEVPNNAAGKTRLVTYNAGQGVRVGVVKASGRIVDLAAAAKAQRVRLAAEARSMVALIAAGPRALDLARRVAEKAPDDGPALGSVRLLPPIPNPMRNVYAVGWNYLAHIEETQGMHGGAPVKPPEHPVFFSKAVHVINGPYDPIPFDPEVSTQIDWEGELAVVIGKRGKNVAEKDAMNHVFGYMVINDTTARDLQLHKHGGQWFKGKSLDGHGPIGPWIVPASELGYGGLHLTTRVNGIVKQDASTDQMYFKVPRIIAELTQGLTLEPGDIIATGTPPGIGAARNPPEFMKPGDVMETEIAEIGVLRNTITQVQHMAMKG